MAETVQTEQEKWAAAEAAGTKPPAITVRCDDWDTFRWIAEAAAKRDQSKGEFCLLSTVQRRGGGPVPQGRKAKAAAARTGVQTSAEAKASVKPIPKRGQA